MASDNLNENYTKIVIHVNDVNDNPPVFDRPTYETQITEEDDRNLPKRVLKVNAKPKLSTVVLLLAFALFTYFCLVLIQPFYFTCFIRTGSGNETPHRKWREIDLQPSCWLQLALPGWCLVSLLFL